MHVLIVLVLLFSPISSLIAKNYTDRFCGELVIDKLSRDQLAPLEDRCRIIIMRHAETDWNVQGKSQGWEDIPLNEEGRRQAQMLAYNFSEISLAAIYSSILSRAVETTQLIAMYHPDCLIVGDGSLRFYDPSKKQPHDGLTQDEVEEMIAEEIASASYAYLSDVCKKHLGQNVMVITHGKVIKHLVEKIGGDRLKTVKVKIDNAAMVRLLGDGEVLTLESEL